MKHLDVSCPCYGKQCVCGVVYPRECRCRRAWKHDNNKGDIMLPLDASDQCLWSDHE